MILAIIVFISPLIGFAVFFYLIIKNARKSAEKWRAEIREDISLLRESIQQLKTIRERLEMRVERVEILPSSLGAECIPYISLANYPKRKGRYPEPILVLASAR